jgi:ectoine hydroxylase-related dioxygenase (phytanoyl-CoA dioxygenase family)
VRGALVSVLGPEMAMHAHRHCHRLSPGSGGQRWHQDDVNHRHHQIWRVLAMYYPQDVTPEMGPTLILPGTQYRNAPTARMASYGAFTSQVPLTVRAGTVAVTHYDIWHRATPNRSGRPRQMLKFLFDRTRPPEGPSWRADPAWREQMPVEFIRQWLPIDNQTDAYKHRVIWMNLWQWLYGRRDGHEDSIIDRYP